MNETNTRCCRSNARFWGSWSTAVCCEVAFTHHCHTLTAVSLSLKLLHISRVLCPGILCLLQQRHQMLTLWLFWIVAESSTFSLLEVISDCFGAFSFCSFFNRSYFRNYNETYQISFFLWLYIPQREAEVDQNFVLGWALKLDLHCSTLREVVDHITQFKHKRHNLQTAEEEWSTSLLKQTMYYSFYLDIVSLSHRSVCVPGSRRQRSCQNKDLKSFRQYVS